MILLEGVANSKKRKPFNNWGGDETIFTDRFVGAPSLIWELGNGISVVIGSGAGGRGRKSSRGRGQVDGIGLLGLGGLDMKD